MTSRDRPILEKAVNSFDLRMAMNPAQQETPFFNRQEPINQSSASVLFAKDASDICQLKGKYVIED